MSLQEQLCAWENIQLAYKNASRGKRGRAATAVFEMLLADNLLELQSELTGHDYRPGGYASFYIHEPKKRLISAAPFRNRVVHHALCNFLTILILYPIYQALLQAGKTGKSSIPFLNKPPSSRGTP